jgi:hypothetical protein
MNNFPHKLKMMGKVKGKRLKMSEEKIKTDN